MCYERQDNLFNAVFRKQNTLVKGGGGRASGGKGGKEKHWIAFWKILRLNYVTIEVHCLENLN